MKKHSKKKTSTKKYFIVLCITFSVLLFGSVILNAIVDPFYNYRMKSEVDQQDSVFEQKYSPTWRVGMSRHTTGYDSIWVGSSLSSHIDVNYVNEQFGTNCLTSVIASGRPNIYKEFIQNAMKTNDIKTVYYEICIDHLEWEKIGTEYDMSMVPDYIRTDTVTDDVPYLFNRIVTVQSLMELKNRITRKINEKKLEEEAAKLAESAAAMATPEPIAAAGSSTVSPEATASIEVTASPEVTAGVEVTTSPEGTASKDRAENAIIPADTEYSMKAMATRLSRNVVRKMTEEMVYGYIQTGIKNIRENIAPLMEANPDVRFVFVIPPTGITKFVICRDSGVLDAYIESNKALIQELLSYPNAEVYNCIADLEYNLNLDNYMDDGHFEPLGMKRVVDEVKLGYYRMTPENLDTTYEPIKKAAEKFKWPFYKRNFSGKKIKIFKKRLVALGYKLTMSYTYDPTTVSAVQKFQRDNGIEETGIAYEDTLKLVKEKYKALRDGQE